MFQAAGPEKLNPRSPNLVLVQRLTYLAVFAERRPDRRLVTLTAHHVFEEFHETCTVRRKQFQLENHRTWTETTNEHVSS